MRSGDTGRSTSSCLADAHNLHVQINTTSLDIITLHIVVQQIFRQFICSFGGGDEVLPSFFSMRVVSLSGRLARLWRRTLNGVYGPSGG